ncbi:aldehyde dehydrogenase family protein [Thermobifida halotolerans]|uniref:Aldehyde dehydrogenase family protein n=1 Tax=Thermobifida halotolerans TaxID=483545 RepID=A0A399FWK8_9ACTN|nr:aldehyde dehydrogenase family protein [Thermobifida halotolerans]UOE21248.1 aldehyde dehydrogenase family protein [Thermobifida halotolerans]
MATRRTDPHHRYWLAGERRKPDDTPTLPVVSPVDGTVVGGVHEYTREQIDLCFAAARQAQPRWFARPLTERTELLLRFADLLADNAERIGEVLMMEVAKARRDARDEVARSADYVRHTAEDAKRVIGDSQFSDAFPGQARDKLAVVHRVPLGTVLAIPPFNYPVNLAVSKIAPALATGNAVVLKPPSQGALSALMMCDLAHEAGIPPEVLQAVTGRGSRIGDYLVQHGDVDLITFTGSSGTGAELARKAGMVPLLLELGGKDPAIVLADADIDAAAADIVSGAFSYSGQRCTAVKRVLVVDAVADRLVAAVAQRAAELTVGDPRDNARITPLVDADAAVGAERMVQDAVARGATLVCGGDREGNLVRPTVVDRVTEDMDLAWVEPFAPVLPVIRVRSAEEAIRISNRSEYGLQAAVFTRDIDLAIQVAARLDVGTVQVNGRTARGPDHFPFLGTKASGMGTQGVRPSIEAMTRVKSLVVNLHAKDLAAVS